LSENDKKNVETIIKLNDIHDMQERIEKEDMLEIENQLLTVNKYQNLKSCIHFTKSPNLL